jgi:hypothetical protein
MRSRSGAEKLLVRPSATGRDAGGAAVARAGARAIAGALAVFAGAAPRRCAGGSAGATAAGSGQRDGGADALANVLSTRAIACPQTRL